MGKHALQELWAQTWLQKNQNYWNDKNKKECNTVTGNASDMVKGNLHRKKVKKLGIFLKKLHIDNQQRPIYMS